MCVCDHYLHGMGIVRLPERTMYWKGQFRQQFCGSYMSYTRIDIIFRKVHSVDSSGLTLAQRTAKNMENAFWPVGTYVSQLATLFQLHYNVTQNCNIDEQCCPMKGRHRCRCYNPNKPEKWHFKVYCLNCSNTGYISNFYLYQGKDEERPAGISATSYQRDGWCRLF